MLTKGAPSVRSAALSLDGGRLVTIEQETTDSKSNSRLWNLAESAPQPLVSTLKGVPHTFAADGTLVTVEVAGAGRATRIDNLRRYDVSGTAPRDMGTIKLPPTSDFHGGLEVKTTSAIVVYSERTPDHVTLWHGNGDGDLKPCKLPTAEKYPSYFNPISADGDRIVTEVGDSPNRAAKVWDLTGPSAREIAIVRGAPVMAPTHTTVKETIGPDGQRVEKSHVEEVPREPRPFQLWTVALARDGKALALADLEGTIQVWQLTGAEPRLSATLVDHRQERVMGAVQRMAFDNAGKQLVSVGSDCKIIAWNLATGKPSYTATLPGVALDARFAPDDRHLLTLNPDGTLYVLRLPER